MVDGVVDLPAADSLFQQVGAPAGRAAAGAAGQRDPAARRRCSPRLERATAGTQVHAATRPPRCRRARRRLHRRQRPQAQPRDQAHRHGPGRRQPRHGARPGARGRALRPAAVPVPRACRARSSPAWSPSSIASAGADRRRRDAALLRTRGASTRQLVRLALAETALGGGRSASLVGLGVALLIGAGAVRHRELRRRHARRRPVGRRRGSSPGVAIAAASIARARLARRPRPDGRRPAPQRRPRAPRVRGGRATGVDILAWSRRGARLLAGLAQRLQPGARARGCRPGLGQLVRAAGARARAGSARGLLAYRIADVVLVRGRTPLARLFCARWPASSSPTVAATMGRQRRLLARCGGAASR